jgi:hypothetical protein
MEPYQHYPHTPSGRGAWLIKCKNKFTLRFGLCSLCSGSSGRFASIGISALNKSDISIAYGVTYSARFSIPASQHNFSSYSRYFRKSRFLRASRWNVSGFSASGKQIRLPIKRLHVRSPNRQTVVAQCLGFLRTGSASRPARRRVIRWLVMWNGFGRKRYYPDTTL